MDIEGASLDYSLALTRISVVPVQLIEFGLARFSAFSAQLRWEFKLKIFSSLLHCAIINSN